MRKRKTKVKKIWVRKKEVLQRANEIVKPHGLTAEFLGDVFSVGVGGDDRTYTPVIVLVGPHPGDEILAQLSTRISNELPINRVTIELARRSSS